MAGNPCNEIGQIITFLMISHSKGVIGLASQAVTKVSNGTKQYVQMYVMFRVASGDCDPG